MQTIVIAGGGAGGLELATRLGDAMGATGRARIVLVDRYPTHFWKPLLHKAASGKRDPQVDQIDYAAQAAEHGFEFVLAEVTSIHRGSRTVDLAPPKEDAGFISAPCRMLGYDKLVLDVSWDSSRDIAKKTMTIRDFTIHIHDGGDLSITGVMGNLPDPRILDDAGAASKASKAEVHKLTVRYEDKEFLTVPLVAAAAVDQGSFVSRSIDQLRMMIGR